MNPNPLLEPPIKQSSTAYFEIIIRCRDSEFLRRPCFDELVPSPPAKLDGAPVVPLPSQFDQTMRLFALLPVFWVVLSFSHARASAIDLETRALGIADIPPCGLVCMLSAFPSSGCSLDDKACLCSNAELAATVPACMLANCTMQDSLEVSRVRAKACNLSNESNRVHLFITTSVVYSVAFVLVALRIAGKLVIKRLAMDDYIVVFSLLLCAVPTGTALAMTQRGFGEHLWNLEDGALEDILRFFYIGWSTSVVGLVLIKLSLIAFYLEIFQTRSFRITAYILGILIIINSTIIFFLSMFICMPVESFWNRDMKRKCMGIPAIPIANSVSALAQDILLLILPLSFIRRLQMKRHRKVAVGIMFAIGTFGCIATTIRLLILLKFRISVDPTWDYVSITIWTELELLACFACASLPAIRILVIKLLPNNAFSFFTQVTHSSKQKNSDPKHAHVHAVPEAEAAPKGRRKPQGWDWVSMGTEEHDSTLASRKSRISGRWPWVATSPLTARFSSHPRSGSRLLSSAMSNHSELNARTRTWELREIGVQKNAAELSHVAEDDVGICDRYDTIDDEITASPKIGCLPERSYSGENEYRKSPRRFADK